MSIDRLRIWSALTLGLCPPHAALSSQGLVVLHHAACITTFTATYMITRHAASLGEAELYIAAMQAASVVGRIGLAGMIRKSIFVLDRDAADVQRVDR